LFGPDSEEDVKRTMADFSRVVFEFGLVWLALPAFSVRIVQDGGIGVFDFGFDFIHDRKFVDFVVFSIDDFDQNRVEVLHRHVLLLVQQMKKHFVIDL